MNAATYTVRVTLKSGAIHFLCRKTTIKHAAAAVDTVVNASEAKTGYIRTVTIIRDGDGSVWEWLYGMGVVTE